MNTCPKRHHVFCLFLCHAEFHCHGSLATICCRRFCCYRESWTKQLSLWWLPQSKSEERFEVGLDLQSTLGGVSELGVDGWLWVRLDGEFPNSKSAGLVKSLTDWSQLKRCKDVFVNLTSWSTRSHTWLGCVQKYPWPSCSEQEKDTRVVDETQLRFFRLAVQQAEVNHAGGLVGNEADETWT